MKTRAKIREEEDERAANATPVRTSTRVTRSNPNANGRGRYRTIDRASNPSTSKVGRVMHFALSC